MSCLNVSELTGGEPVESFAEKQLDRSSGRRIVLYVPLLVIWKLGLRGLAVAEYDSFHAGDVSLRDTRR